MTHAMFDLQDRVAVVTGGSGVLGSVMAKGLLEAGARVCIFGRDLARAREAGQALGGPEGRVLALAADVSQRETLEQAAEAITAQWGRIDILVNAAGGNRPDATASPGQGFFDLAPDALRAAVDVNLLGTILPSQVFGQAMARAQEG